jgi:hypothetical protein
MIRCAALASRARRARWAGLAAARALAGATIAALAG